MCFGAGVLAGSSEPEEPLVTLQISGKWGWLGDRQVTHRFICLIYSYLLSPSSSPATIVGAGPPRKQQNNVRLSQNSHSGGETHNNNNNTYLESESGLGGSHESLTVSPRPVPTAAVPSTRLPGAWEGSRLCILTSTRSSRVGVTHLAGCAVLSHRGLVSAYSRLRMLNRVVSHASWPFTVLNVAKLFTKNG